MVKPHTSEKRVTCECKIKIQYVSKKLLFKEILVFTSIYFKSYCKIPARSNKSMLQSFYHKIHLCVKGILKQNKQMKTKFRPGFIQPARVDSDQCQKRNHLRTRKKQEIKTYTQFWWSCHYLHLPPAPFLSKLLGTAVSPNSSDLILYWWCHEKKKLVT